MPQGLIHKVRAAFGVDRGLIGDSARSVDVV
jgi:hypothetical protein